MQVEESVSAIDYARNSAGNELWPYDDKNEINIDPEQVYDEKYDQQFDEICDFIQFLADVSLNEVSIHSNTHTEVYVGNPYRCLENEVCLASNIIYHNNYDIIFKEPKILKDFQQTEGNLLSQFCQERTYLSFYQKISEQIKNSIESLIKIIDKNLEDSNKNYPNIVTNSNNNAQTENSGRIVLSFNEIDDNLYQDDIDLPLTKRAKTDQPSISTHYFFVKKISQS